MVHNPLIFHIIYHKFGSECFKTSDQHSVHFQFPEHESAQLTPDYQLLNKSPNHKRDLDD